MAKSLSAPGSPGAKKTKVLMTTLTVLLGIVAAVLGIVSADPDTSVPVPEQDERADTVAVLSRATAAQGVCYGWQLSRGSYLSAYVVSEGSNLGDGVAVDSDPASCPRWLRVVAEVTYTPEESESEDYAYIRVERSPGLDVAISAASLERFDLDEKAFIDDPGWAVCRAAVVLPLLLAEAGGAPAAPVATAMPTAPPAPLPPAGSDLWRDRWGYLLGGGAVLFLSVLLLAIGWIQRRHERRAEPAGWTRT